MTVLLDLEQGVFSLVLPFVVVISYDFLFRQCKMVNSYNTNFGSISLLILKAKLFHCRMALCNAAGGFIG
jgi:hypothetical protein